MFTSLVFYAISALLIISSLVVVLRRNIFTCGLYLAVALSSIAGLFVLLSADFLAATQILLYVGGILVIIIFAVMLSSPQQSQSQPQINFRFLPAVLLGAILISTILLGLKRFPFPPSDTPLKYEPTTQALGTFLLKDAALPFELVSLILLAALIGAILFAKKESK